MPGRVLQGSWKRGFNWPIGAPRSKSHSAGRQECQECQGCQGYLFDGVDGIMMVGWMDGSSDGMIIAV
jgi:hypothetical protein